MAHPDTPAQQGSAMTTTGRTLHELIEDFTSFQPTPEEQRAIEAEWQAEEQTRQQLRDEYRQMLAEHPSMREALGSRTLADLIDEDRGER